MTEDMSAQNYDILRLTADLSSVPTNSKVYADTVGARRIQVDRALPGVGRGTLFESFDYSFNLAKSHKLAEGDIFYIDDTTILPAAPVLKIRFPNVPILFNFSDHRLFGTAAYDFGNGIEQRIRQVERKLDTQILRIALRRYVDGVLAISPMCANLTKQINREIPTRTFGPFIFPNIHEDLNDATPSLNSNSVITVARGIDPKGIDLLVEAWEVVRDQFPEARLHIVGPGHPSEYGRVPGIIMHGYIENKHIPNYLQKTSLFVCPSRIDAHPIAVAEALCAGLPCIVTQTTGARTNVSDFSKSMVTGSSPQQIAEAICDYFRYPLEQRLDLSRQARELSEKYRIDDRKHEFVNSFNDLLNEIQA